MNRLPFKMVKTQLVSATAISLILCSGSSYASMWTLSSNSQVGFHIDSMGMRVVNAQFNRVQSSLNFDPKAPQNASVNFSMDVNSLSFNKASLKNMILGEDLFYAAKFKTVTFKSTAFKPLGANKYNVLGNLTVRGVTRPVTFSSIIIPNASNPKLMSINASTVIRRSDFGMKKALGGVGEKVNIQVTGQWVAQ